MAVVCNSKRKKSNIVDLRIEMIGQMNDEFLLLVADCDIVGLRELAFRYMENKMPLRASRVFKEISILEQYRKNVPILKKNSIIMGGSTLSGLGGTDVQEDFRKDKQDGCVQSAYAGAGGDQPGTSVPSRTP